MSQTEPIDHTRRPAAGSRPSRLLTGLLYMVVALILTQASLAGLFVSATMNARMAHLIIGSLLPWFAIAPAAVAFIHRRMLTQWVVTGSILLPFALWVQEMLGHMPFAVSTAVHVPLGVALFGLSIVIAHGSTRAR